MKEKAWMLLSTMLIGCMYGCTAPYLEDIGAGDHAVRIVSAEESRQFAEAFVRAFIGGVPEGAVGSWTDSSICDRVFPVYNEGFEHPVYYECRIKTEGTNAGYVLVNTDGTDLPVPEFSTEGPTFTEAFRGLLGNSDFVVYRYGYLGVRAISSKLPVGPELRSKSLAERTLASFGVDDLESCYGEWGMLSEERGAVPYYSRETLALCREKAAQVKSARASQTIPSAEYAELSHRLSGRAYSTPPWNQKKWFGSELPISGLDPLRTYSIGCTPTAWGIVYAYWHAFKGKTGLYPGVDLSIDLNWSWGWMTNETVYDSIRLMATFMGTWYTSDGSGSTLWVWDGQKYAWGRGYPNTTVTTTAIQPLQWVMYNAVRDAIRADRPPIISLHVAPNGQVDTGLIPNHTIVVERARKGIYRDQFLDWWWWPWADGTAEMYVNMGWGWGETNSTFNYRWITTIDVNPYYSPPGSLTWPAYVFDINVR